MVDQHITTIETKLAHQEQQIQDLSDMISKQWKEIDVLRKLLSKTELRLGELENTGTDPFSDTQAIDHEKPPHY